MTTYEKKSKIMQLGRIYRQKMSAMEAKTKSLRK
jgi:hypothetical protein